MEKDELKNLAGREGVPLGTMEKDYVITVVLSLISKLSYYRELVFKGGTCIKKVYFPQARFSVDMDFSCLKDVSRLILSDLQDSLGNKTIKGIEFMEVVEEERREDSVRHSVKYKDLNAHPTSVKLDLSLREKLVKEPITKEVLNPFYKEIPLFEIVALSLKELLAEKMRAVIARGAPRDVYDIWYLLQNGVKVDLEIVNEKLKILKRDRIFNWKLFNNCLEDSGKGWKRDLVMLVPNAPDFNQVKSEIQLAISNHKKGITNQGSGRV